MFLSGADPLVAPDSLSSSTRRPHQRCWSLNHSLICAGFLPAPRLSGKKACTSHRMKRGRRTRPHSRSPHPSPCIHLSLSSRVDLSQSLVPPLRLPLFVFYLSSDCWISSLYVAIDRPLKLHLCCLILYSCDESVKRICVCLCVRVLCDRLTGRKTWRTSSSQCWRRSGG